LDLSLRTAREQQDGRKSKLVRCSFKLVNQSAPAPKLSFAVIAPRIGYLDSLGIVPGVKLE
jgi:hypothetical protein